MDNIFICAICGTECKRLHGLAIHLKHHNIDAETYYDTYIDTSDHTCPYCSSKRKFKNFSYITTCGSRKCYQKAMEATCLSKYGVTNNLKRNISSRILKRKETCLIKYGVDNPTKSATIKEKISKNNKSNTLEVKNKISNTLLNKTDSDKNADELKLYKFCVENGITIEYLPKNFNYVDFLVLIINIYRILGFVVNTTRLRVTICGKKEDCILLIGIN